MTSYSKLGDELFKSHNAQISGEIFAMTYGALVAQLWDQYGQDANKVNEELDRLGYDTGLRLIEEFLARSQLNRCTDFKQTAEVISKVGFKMFLGISPQVVNWSRDGKEFQLKFVENPLTEFVELPVGGQGLWYSNVLAGVLRGCLDMVALKCEVTWVSDTLRGDPASLLSVKLLKVAQEEIPAGEE